MNLKRVPHKGPSVSMPIRDCILDVYVPSKAPIPWLDDRVVDFKYQTPDSPTYLAPQTPEDQAWRRRAVGIPVAGKRSRRNLIHVHAGGKKLGGLLLREYDKQVYPGIAYLSFDKGCVTPPRVTTTVDFSDSDDPYSSEGRYTIRHQIVLPSEFMQRLYLHWVEYSRRPAEAQWEHVIEENRK